MSCVFLPKDIKVILDITSYHRAINEIWQFWFSWKNDGSVYQENLEERMEHLIKLCLEFEDRAQKFEFRNTYIPPVKRLGEKAAKASRRRMGTTQC